MDSNYGLYRAYQTIQMPPGCVPSVVHANEVVVIHQAVLGIERIQSLIKQGLLRPEPAQPAPITETVLAGFAEVVEIAPPTAGEIIEALKQHPDIFNEVQMYLVIHFVNRETAKSIQSDLGVDPNLLNSSTKYATSGIAMDMLQKYGEADAKMAFDLYQRGVPTDPLPPATRYSNQVAPTADSIIATALSSKEGRAKLGATLTLHLEIQKEREGARKDQFINGGPFRAMKKLFGLDGE